MHLSPGSDVLYGCWETSTTIDSSVVASQARAKAALAQKAFEAQVLSPHGIEIVVSTNAISPIMQADSEKRPSVWNTLRRDPFQHLDNPPLGHSLLGYNPFISRSNHYRSSERLRDTGVWLEPNENFAEHVARAYRSVIRVKACDAGFVALAHELLLKWDFMDMDPTTSKARYWLVQRMIQFKPKEAAEYNWLWKQPPQLLDGGPVHISSENIFDVIPDVSYWISTKGFSLPTRSIAWKFVLVCRLERITCPYFTVDFEKRSDEVTLKATNRVAVAGSRALYNRWLLRDRRVKTEKREWTAADWSCMRHYALTMDGSDFWFWCLQPHEEALSGNKWTGCRMKFLYQADCTYSHKVEDICDWLNEIHKWGLTEHALSCQDDIEIVGEVRERERGPHK